MRQRRSPLTRWKRTKGSEAVAEKAGSLAPRRGGRRAGSRLLEVPSAREPALTVLHLPLPRCMHGNADRERGGTVGQLWARRLACLASDARRADVAGASADRTGRGRLD
jgi:hypothetical protein